ncbi:MAG: general secretion pathway protein GspC [Oleiphilus sp.]|nr:MAG: general secretion pathway protein GspC [Oleiphilus sp.]
MTEKVNTQSKQSDRILGLIQGLLLLAFTVYLAWLTAHLAWYFVADQESAAMVLGETSMMPAAKQNVRHAQLPAFHLFGEENKKPKVVSDQPKEAPKTRLRLLLKGVFTGDSGGESGAIIEELGRRSAEYYRLGDKVPGNATLEEVYSDRVLLRRAGKLETLAFDEVADKGSSIAASSRPRQITPDPEVIETPEEFIAEATRRLAEDPERALKSVGLAPGEGGGYVYQGRNPMLAGMNLEKGDVIMSVNGHTLGDVQRDKELMKSLYEQGSLEVEVVRDGASFYVNYPLR